MRYGSPARPGSSSTFSQAASTQVFFESTPTYPGPRSRTAANMSLQPPVLHLHRCLIRPHNDTDAEAIAIAANHLDIAKWMRNTFPHPYSVEDAAKFITFARSQSPLREFAICTPDGRTVIGGIGLKARDDIHHRTMELGYWLGTDYWGQGIATEAIASFSDWTFEHFQHILRIEAEVLEGNDGSIRALEKARYVLEARKKKAVDKAGMIFDAFVYCRFRDSDDDIALKVSH